MPNHEDCVPSEPGYYWATSRRFAWRAIVLLGKNGFGHMRAYEARGSSSRDPADFRDYSARIADPRECGRPAENLRAMILEAKCRVTDEDFRQAELGRDQEEWLIEQLVERGYTKGRTPERENEWWPPSTDDAILPSQEGRTMTDTKGGRPGSAGGQSSGVPSEGMEKGQSGGGSSPEGTKGADKTGTVKKAVLDENTLKQGREVGGLDEVAGGQPKK